MKPVTPWVFDDALKAYNLILTVNPVEQVEVEVPGFSRWYFVLSATRFSSRSHCPLHQYVFLPAPNVHTVL